jgi:hypothetical protein
MLSPPGAVRNKANLASWLMPVMLAISVALPMLLRRRRWNVDAPEVKAVEQDEWQARAGRSQES